MLERLESLATSTKPRSIRISGDCYETEPVFSFVMTAPKPKQKRAAETLERILVAAEAMLADGLFEAMTMASLAERAGIAVGTIYTRFKTKDDLLPVLFERHNQAVVRQVEALAAELAEGRSIEARMATVIRFAVAYHVEHLGLLRALTHFVRSHPESASAQVMAERQGQYRAIAGLVAGPRSSAARRAQVEFALGVVNSVCRDQVLFHEVSPSARGKSATELQRRLVDLIQPQLTSRVIS